VRLTSANTSSRDAAEGCVEQRRVGAFAEVDLLMVGARRNHEASTPGYASPQGFNPADFDLKAWVVVFAARSDRPPNRGNFNLDPASGNRQLVVKPGPLIER
jgi:hypothetical protein